MGAESCQEKLVSSAPCRPPLYDRWSGRSARPSRMQVGAAIADMRQIKHFTEHISGRQGRAHAPGAQLLGLLINLQVGSLDAALQCFGDRIASSGMRVWRQKDSNARRLATPPCGITAHAVGECKERAVTSRVRHFRGQVNGILVVLAHWADDAQSAAFNFRWTNFVKGSPMLYPFLSLQSGKWGDQQRYTHLKIG